MKMEATTSRYKYPIEYELNPTSVDKGNSWLTLKLKNTSRDTLKGVDIQLHSLDTYYLMSMEHGGDMDLDNTLRSLSQMKRSNWFSGLMH